MKHNFKNSIRFLSVFLAVLFILYTYPMAAIAESPAETEAIPYEPDVEEISQEELSGIYGSEDESTEVEVIGEKSDLRDATVKHYRMSDGTFRAVDYGTAVHFKNDAAEWTDFDNDLVLNDTVDSADSEDFAGYEPEKNDVKIKFAQNTNSSNLLKINYDDFQISFGLQNANKSKPVIDNGEADPNDPYAVPGVTSKITYPEVFDNVDLVYILDGNNVKEYFVISKDAEVFEYIFDIKVKNVTPSVDDDGNVVFTKDDNTVVYTIPKGYMYDSSMGYSEGVTYTVEQVKNKKYTLTITVDEQWITDDERVYPVVVDPTVVLNKYANATDTYYGNIETSYKDMNSGNVPFNNTDHIYIGISKDDDNTTYDYNARLKVLNLPELPENTILCNASFLMYQLSGNYGYSYTALNGLYVGAYEPSSGSNLYTPSSTLLDYAVYSANSCGTFSQLDVTPAARDWYSDSSTNNGIVLRATNNTDSSYANVRLYGCYSANSANVNQPRFVISYRHTVGIENYYTYETISNGRAGTVYLNANTGQTVVVNDLITTNNLAAPYTVSLVYNSVYAKTQFTNNATADIHTADYTNMKLGAGWKLNSQISVVEVTLDSFIPGDDASYLIFCDGDGTEHYFAQSEDNENIYKDEDGLGLEIEVLSDTTYGKYKMTDDKDNITMFSGYGYVVSSTDSNGNIIIYNYDTAEDKRKLMSISVQNDGGSAVKVAQFAYDLSNYLTSVTDQYGRVTTLGYNAMSPKELVTITCPDGKTCTYYYDNTARKVSEIIDNESSYKTKLFYDSSLNMVSKIQEYGGTTSGSALSITYEGSERTTIKYSGNDGTLGSSDDIANAYHFDYWGRCTNIHTVNPTTLKVYGSSSASYTSPDSSTSKQTNRISSSSTIGVQPVNMLINTGAEVLYGNDTTTNIASYFYRPTLETGETVERSTAYAHTGNASMKVSATTASASELYTYYIVSGLTVGNTYTFSAYAKASSFSTTAVGGGYFLKAGGNYSAKLTKAMDSESDNGWTKLSVTFTATTTGKTLLYAGLVNATGTVYFDDFQLAKGGDVDQVSLISDGGMDKGSRSYWGFAGSQFSTTRPLSGTTSIQINGSPTEAKSASYTIPIKKSAKNTYVYSGWAYASSVPLLKGTNQTNPHSAFLPVSPILITQANGTEKTSARITNPGGSTFQCRSFPNNQTRPSPP